MLLVGFREFVLRLAKRSLCVYVKKSTLPCLLRYNFIVVIYCKAHDLALSYIVSEIRWSNPCTREWDGNTSEMTIPSKQMKFFNRSNLIRFSWQGYCFVSKKEACRFTKVSVSQTDWRDSRTRILAYPTLKRVTRTCHIEEWNKVSISLTPIPNMTHDGIHVYGIFEKASRVLCHRNDFSSLLRTINHQVAAAGSWVDLHKSPEWRSVRRTRQASLSQTIENAPSLTQRQGKERLRQGFHGRVAVEIPLHLVSDKGDCSRMSSSPRGSTGTVRAKTRAKTVGDHRGTLESSSSMYRDKDSDKEIRII